MINIFKIIIIKINGKFKCIKYISKLIKSKNEYKLNILKWVKD